MDRLKLSSRLRQARIEAGLKQEEIAKLMNLPISAISVIENGSRKVEVLELVKFSEYYSKPLEWFFHDKKMQNHRRWYDHDKFLAEAMELVRKAPPKYQKSCAYAIIGFLKNSGLVK